LDLKLEFLLQPTIDIEMKEGELAVIQDGEYYNNYFIFNFNNYILTYYTAIDKTEPILMMIEPINGIANEDTTSTESKNILLLSFILNALLQEKS